MKTFSLVPWFLFRHRDGERGQGLGLVAIAFLALLAFVGLVTDVGMLYLSYGQLKRAVDAAAIAAAGEFKRGVTVNEMKAAADELLKFHNVDPTTVDLDVLICDNNGDGLRDPVDTTPPYDTGIPQNLYQICPDTAAGLAPLKLVYVDATQRSPVYFLHLFGIQSIPVSTNAVAEAAAIDMLVVIDTSESMGSYSSDYVDVQDYDPTNCNSTNSCYPLRQAKDAAKALVGTLYDGYDRVSVVTFDYYGRIQYGLSDNLGDDDGASDGDAFAAIDGILLHDDAPYGRLWANWQQAGKVNLVNPEDRDGDGEDADPTLPCTDDPNDKWDDVLGVPCDLDNQEDAYDWNKDGIFTGADHAGIQAYIDLWKHPASPISTCTGCGLRVATEVLRANGRPDSIWVIVFLSDGLANLSDLPAYGAACGIGDVKAGKTCIPGGGSAGITTDYRNGFCGGYLDEPFWTDNCLDRNRFWQGVGFAPLGLETDTARYCIDTVSAECPPGTTVQAFPIRPPSYSPRYSVEDYAKDMADEASLATSTNVNEPLGSDIGIYTIGLQYAGTLQHASDLLRYIAAVGDDGNRDTDPCKPPLLPPVALATSCGQYYYAPSGAALQAIFEDIASRIFTRISQ